MNSIRSSSTDVQSHHLTSFALLCFALFHLSTLRQHRSTDSTIHAQPRHAKKHNNPPDDLVTGHDSTRVRNTSIRLPPFSQTRLSPFPPRNENPPICFPVQRHRYLHSPLPVCARPHTRPNVPHHAPRAGGAFPGLCPAIRGDRWVRGRKRARLRWDSSCYQGCDCGRATAGRGGTESGAVERGSSQVNFSSVMVDKTERSWRIAIVWEDRGSTTLTLGGAIVRYECLFVSPRWQK